jgi:hypothetical protein
VDELTANVNWGAIMAKLFARFKFVADVPAALLDTAAKPATITLHAVVEAGLDSVGINFVDPNRLEACKTHLSTKVACAEDALVHAAGEQAHAGNAGPRVGRRSCTSSATTGPTGSSMCGRP